MSRTFLLALILTLVVAGCGSPNSATPTFESPFQSPLPKPTTVSSPTPVLVTPISAPDVGLGTVTGVLVETEEGQPSDPKGSALLFLAPLIYSTDGAYEMANLNKGRDPASVTDEAGRFVFPNVEPKTYALVYSVVTHEFLLKAPGSDEDLLIDVVADQITDLGTVYVEAP